MGHVFVIDKEYFRKDQIEIFISGQYEVILTSEGVRHNLIGGVWTVLHWDDGIKCRLDYDDDVITLNYTTNSNQTMIEFEYSGKATINENE